MQRTSWNKTLVTILAGTMAAAPCCTRESAADWSDARARAGGAHPAPAPAYPLVGPTWSGRHHPQPTPPLYHPPGNAPRVPARPPQVTQTNTDSHGQYTHQPPKHETPHTTPRRQDKTPPPDQRIGGRPHPTPRPYKPNPNGKQPNPVTPPVDRQPQPSVNGRNLHPNHLNPNQGHSGNQDVGSFLGGLGIGLAVGVLAAELGSHKNPGHDQVVIVPSGGASGDGSGAYPGTLGAVPSGGAGSYDTSSLDPTGGYEPNDRSSLSGSAGYDAGGGGWDASANGGNTYAEDAGPSPMETPETDWSSGPESAPVGEPESEGMDAFGSPAPVEASYVRRGEEAFRSRDYDRAAECWKQAVAEQPDVPAAGLLLGQALLATGDYVGAARANWNAMQRLPQEHWGVVVQNHRQLYAPEAVGDYVAQLKKLEAELRNQPDSPAVRFLLGYHHGFGGRKALATKHLKRLAELAPGQPVFASLQTLVAR